MRRLALAVLVVTVAALATEGRAADQPRITNEGCVLPDGYGGSFTETDAKVQSVQNANWIITTCQARLPQGYTIPASAITLRGRTEQPWCRTPYGSTPFWHAVVTPTGQVKLVCKYTRVPNG